MYERQESEVIYTSYLVIYDTPLEQRRKHWSDPKQADDFAREVVESQQASAASVFVEQHRKLATYWR